MKDLAKEYAALVPEWAQPGMRCVDPRNMIAWRKVTRKGQWPWVSDSGSAMRGLAAAMSVIRAIAAGPDLDDAATVGALLVGLGESVQLCRRSSWNADGTLHPYVWAGPVDSFGNGEIGMDTAEAIIRACIAQAKGKK